MSGRYAQGTEVPAERSRAEIERTLQRYGADGFAYVWERHRHMLAFRIGGRLIRFEVPMPDPDDDEFHRTPTGKERSPRAAQDAYEAEVRRRWRALALVIKAKLEAVASGITDLEAEFLAHVVLPAGPTVGQWVRPQLERAYTAGAMPSLLPGSDPALPMPGGTEGE